MPASGETETGGNETGGAELREGPAAPFRPGEAAVVPLDARRRQAEPMPPAATGSLPRPTIRILMIDGSEDDVDLARQLLGGAEGASFRIDWASSGEAGLRRLAAAPYDACLVDAELPDQEGLEVVRTVERRGFKTPVVLLGGDLDGEPDPSCSSKVSPTISTRRSSIPGASSAASASPSPASVPPIAWIIWPSSTR